MEVGGKDRLMKCKETLHFIGRYPVVPQQWRFYGICKEILHCKKNCTPGRRRRGSRTELRGSGFRRQQSWTMCLLASALFFRLLEFPVSLGKGL